MALYPKYAEITYLAALFAGYKSKSVTSAKFAAFFAGFVWWEKYVSLAFPKLRLNPNKAANFTWVILTNKFRGITSIRTKNFAVNWIYALFLFYFKNYGHFGVYLPGGRDKMRF
ncbi:hypothetical protein [Paenibacillus anseongense]|uniref:hypothetical protein n=1 Tax=Paenibacillus anseongense TaxID=2682845 RepID=UPI002DC06125|nr:hypothetical protein [Paenibacillus anseongense]MEC0266007.1 hypothetical protein [Paenibacillus anseongense]